MRDRGTVLQLFHAWLITGTYGLRSSEFPISELWLVDIEAGKEKLEIVGNLAVSYASYYIVHTRSAPGP